MSERKPEDVIDRVVAVVAQYVRNTEQAWHFSVVEEELSRARRVEAEQAEEVNRLREREARFAALFGVPDGGRYQNDWESRAEVIKRKDELIRELAEVMGNAADELDLAAQHKSNPGSTNGTLVQVAAMLRKAGRL